MKMKRNVEKLRESFERTFNHDALTKRGLPTKLYFESIEEELARRIEKEKREGGKRCQRRKISQSVNSVVQTLLDF